MGRRGWGREGEMGEEVRERREEIGRGNGEEER